MGAIETGKPQPGALPLEIGVAVRPFAGATVSGDHYAVCEFPGGVLAVVADGLGHGPEAALAAHLAVSTAEATPDQPLQRLFQLCHEALTATRGAAIAIVSIDLSTQIITWASVGNVDVVLYRSAMENYHARESVLMRSGVVGQRLPSIRPVSLRIKRDDTLIFVTDGISSVFQDRVKPTLPPQILADEILTNHGKATDDALVLVGRWRGRAASGASQEVQFNDSPISPRSD